MPTDSISRLNQVVLLLRQQLKSQAGKKKSNLDKAAASQTRAPGGLRSGEKGLSRLTSARLGTLRKAGITNNYQLKRAFIEKVLASGFGEYLVNEAKFQSMVDEVLSVLIQDEEFGKLLDVAIEPSPEGKQ